MECAVACIALADSIRHRHRWASTSILMSAISAIQHRHLLFQYWRQICLLEKRHSDIGSVPISSSEFIPISDIDVKIISPTGLEPSPLRNLSNHYNTELLCLTVSIRMSDIAYRIKLFSDIDIMSDSALSVRYWKFWYQAQYEIADHGYRTKCSPIDIHRACPLPMSSNYRKQNPCLTTPPQAAMYVKWCCTARRHEWLSDDQQERGRLLIMQWP